MKKRKSASFGQEGRIEALIGKIPAEEVVAVVGVDVVTVVSTAGVAVAVVLAGEDMVKRNLIY